MSNKPSEPAFIYLLADPRVDDIVHRVRYVGVTTRPLTVRLRKHLRAEDRTHRTRWIQKLAREAVEPVIELVEMTDYEHRMEREIYWIAEYRRLGCELVNGNGGGRGGQLNPTEETRRRLSESLLGKNLGHKHTPEACARMSASHKGKRWRYGYVTSAETRAKLSEAFKGRSVSDETRSRMSAARKEYWRLAECRERPTLCGNILGARLTAEQVAAIRCEYRPRIVTRKMLAEKYGVGRTTISSILAGTSWRMVDADG